MELGRIDHTKYSGALAKVAINNTAGFWTANNVTFGIGDQRMDESADLVIGAYLLSIQWWVSATGGS